MTVRAAAVALAGWLLSCSCGGGGADAGTDGGDGDAGRDAGLDAGRDGGRRDGGRDGGRDAGVDAGDGAWARLPGTDHVACPAEYARRPTEMFEWLTDWIDCGPGCRELDTTSLGTGEFIQPGWFDAEADVGYLSVVHASASGTEIFRVIGTDGVTRVALRLSGRYDRTSTSCLGAGIVLGDGHWAMAGLLHPTPDSLEFVVHGGRIDPPGAAPWVTTIERDGHVNAVNRHQIVLRVDGGLALHRIDWEGVESVVPFRTGDRIIVQDIAVAGSDILYSYWDDAFGIMALRMFSGGETYDVIRDTESVDTRMNAFATDGDEVVWYLGHLGGDGPGAFDRVHLHAAVYPTDRMPLSGRELTEIRRGSRGLLQTGFGHVAAVADTMATIVRIEDGRSARITPPDGIRFRNRGGLFITPEEVVLPLHDFVGVRVPRPYGARFVRFDSLAFAE